MRFQVNKEELDILGFTILGSLLSPDEVGFFHDDLISRKILQRAQHGEEKLKEHGENQILRDLGCAHPNYARLIEKSWLNEFIDEVLNDKAIIHGYHGIITDCNEDKGIPSRFHRDSPWLGEVRACVLILMPLVDFTEEAGATEFAPGTHLFKKKPSDEFLERNKKAVLVPAGTVFALDGTTWHRAGKNRTGLYRPLLQMNVQLPFLKQQIDPWSDGRYEGCSDLVKKRMGYNVRCYSHPDEMLSHDRNWKSGNYVT